MKEKSLPNKKKKMSKLTWKDVYNKCNHHEMSQVTQVYKTVKLKSNFKNLLKNYGTLILIIFVIILAILLITFWKSINIMLLALLFLVALMIFAVIYATYSIDLKQDGVYFKANFQKTYIPYKKLIGIYLEKKYKRFFFVPVYYYSLKITEYVDKEKMNIYSFPTIMLNKKALINFFESFDVNVLKDNEEEQEKEQEEKKTIAKAIGIVILIIFIILFVVALLLYFLNK